MPTFDFTAPDGKSYSVDGPDGATPEQAFKILQQHLGSVEKPSMAEDAAKSIAAGLGSGTIGTLGTVGDLTDLGAKGIQHASDFISDKLGIERYQPSGKSFLDNIPTSKSIRATVTDPIVDPDYKPQSTTGEFLKKAGEFAPNLAFGGGVRGAIQNVVAPAIGSVVGENVGGPLGGLVGALVGGAGAGAAAERFKAMAAARTAARNAAPALTADKVLETAGKQFDDARDMNVIVKPDFATNAAEEMRSSIKGYDPNLVKDVHAAADRLEALGSSPKPTIGPAQRLQAEMNWEPLPVAKPPPPVAMNDMEFIRKELVSLKTSADASVRSAAKQAIKSLQKSQMGLTAADTLSGDAGAYRNLISDAVGNWAKGKQAQTVLGKIGNAELNSATAGSGANQDNNMRQAIKQLARNTNNTNLPVWKKLGFSDQAGAAIDQAARGTTFGNVMRGIGKGAPTGVVSAAGGLGIGHMAGGPVGAVALPAAGYIAKKIGDLSTKRAASAITSLVLSESPLAAQVAAQLPPQVIQQMPARAQRLLQALVLAEPTLAQQSGQPVSQGNTY